MTEPTAWPEEELVSTFRISVDFLVSATDVPQARELVDRVLRSAQAVTQWVRPDATTEDGRGLVGVQDWEHGRPHPSQTAAPVKPEYPGLVNDLALVNVLRVLTARRWSLELLNVMFPDETWDRLDALVQDTDRRVRVDDPDTQGARLIYDGPASRAADWLNEGVYTAYDYEDRQHLLVVGPSATTASWRTSAVFPTNRRDAAELDQISRLLREYDREQSPAELLRLISGRVNATRRPSFPSWMPLADQQGTPSHGPSAAGAFAVVRLDGDPDAPPVVMAHADRDQAARAAARLVYDEIADLGSASTWVAGFLAVHGDPGRLESAGEVTRWLEALQQHTSRPRVDIVDQHPSGGDAGRDPVRAVLAERAAELSDDPSQVGPTTDRPGWDAAGRN